MTNRAWHRNAWLWIWLAIAAALTVFSVYWWEYQTPDPANVAPGGWGSDTSKVDAAYLRFGLITATVPIAVAIAVVGSIVLARRARARA